MQPKTKTQQATTLTVAGAAAALMAWGLREFGGIDMPGEIVAAVSVLIGWGVAKVEAMT